MFFKEIGCCFDCDGGCLIRRETVGSCADRWERDGADVVVAGELQRDTPRGVGGLRQRELHHLRCCRRLSAR